MLERLFGLAFKFRPVIFAQGDLAFSPPWPAMLAVLAALAAACGRGVGLPPPSGARHVDARPPGPARPAPRHDRRRPRLPAPAGARAPRRRAAAQLPRRARGRLAQHDDRGRQRVAAHRVHPRRLRRRGAAARRARAPLHAAATSASRPPPSAPRARTAARYAGTRSNIAQALARTAEELAGLPGLGHRAAERRRRHVGRGPGRDAPLAAVGRPAGVRRRPRPRVARRATSSWAASIRRCRC